MKRTRNIDDLDDIQKAKIKRTVFNPLFDLFKPEFDNAFMERKVLEGDILNKFYIDPRDDANITNESIMKHFHNMLLVKNSPDFANGILENPGLAYLLLGKKGIGKTILLKYFKEKYISQVSAEFKTNMLLIYLDLKTKKSNKTFLEDIHASLNLRIYNELVYKNKEIGKYLYNPIYIKELHEMWQGHDNKYLINHFKENKAEALESLFRYLTSISYDLIFIFDNIDDFKQDKVKCILDYALELKNEYNAKCIIAVRDYWTPKNLGIDDSNLCALHLSRPNVKEIVSTRIKSLKLSATPEEAGLEIKYGDDIIKLKKLDIINTLEIIITDLIDTDSEIYIEILQLANYDMREFLRLFYHYFHSPYLFSRPNFARSLFKNKKIYDDFSGDSFRPTRFFDYLECFMTPHSLCYDRKSSNIFNLFYHNWFYSGENDNYKNTLIYSRILNIVPTGSKTVGKDYVIEQLRDIGYNDEKAIIDAISKLLKAGLLQSPDGRDYDDVFELNISPKGNLYINKIIKEFSYILYINDDVPMERNFKVNMIDKFGEDYIPYQKGDLNAKFESVDRFIKFLRSEEEEEYNQCTEGKRKTVIEDRIMGGTKLSDMINKQFIDTKIKMIGTEGYRKKVSKKISLVKLI